jgi:hypothetical protein
MNHLPLLPGWPYLDPRALKILDFEVGAILCQTPRFEERAKIMVDMVDLAVGFDPTDLKVLSATSGTWSWNPSIYP